MTGEACNRTTSPTIGRRLLYPLSHSCPLWVNQFLKKCFAYFFHPQEVENGSLTFSCNIKNKNTCHVLNICIIYVYCTSRLQLYLLQCKTEHLIILALSAVQKWKCISNHIHPPVHRPSSTTRHKTSIGTWFCRLWTIHSPLLKLNCPKQYELC